MESLGNVDILVAVGSVPVPETWTNGSTLHVEEDLTPDCCEAGALDGRRATNDLKGRLTLQGRYTPYAVECYGAFVVSKLCKSTPESTPSPSGMRL
jgi:hypothetical protein